MSDNFVASAAVYDNANDAKADFATLHDAGLRDITAALVTKSEQGRLHVHEKTHAGKVGAATGVIGGAILGTIFPPARTPPRAHRHGLITWPTCPVLPVWEGPHRTPTVSTQASRSRTCGQPVRPWPDEPTVVGLPPSLGAGPRMPTVGSDSTPRSTRGEAEATRARPLTRPDPVWRTL